MTVGPDKGTTAPTTELGRLVGHSKVVSRVAFNPDETRLASCSADQTVKIWDLDQQQCLMTLSGHTGGISDVCWHPDQGYIATGSDDLNLMLWDASTGQALRKFEGHTHFVYCCKFHPHGSVLVSGGMDEKLIYWDLRTGSCIKQIPAHSDPVTSVDFTWDGTLLATASSDGLCRLWDTGTGLCLKTLMAQKSPPVSHITFSPNGSVLLASALDNTLRLWNWRTEQGRIVRSLSGHANSNYCLPAAFVHTSCVAAASEDGTIAMWDINSGQMRSHDVDTLPPPGPEVPAVPLTAAEIVALKVGAASRPAPTVCPKTPMAFAMMERGEVMVTTQLGDETHSIRMAVRPAAI